MANGSTNPESGVRDKETVRVTQFIFLQIFFLAASTITGGFHFRLWSMLDSALLIQSIGLTGLVIVLDESPIRRRVLNVAIVLYVAAVVDMGINVLVSGVVGWKFP